MSKPLTAKQEMFCREYLVDLNATAAAKRCKYSEATANESAGRLMSDERIKVRIQQLMDVRSNRVSVTADEVLAEVKKIAMIDIGDAYDEKGQLKNIHDIPEDLRRAITQIESDQLFEGFGKDRVQVGETKKLKFSEKLKALELLMRHLKMLTDKVEHSGTLTLEQILEGSYDKEPKE